MTESNEAWENVVQGLVQGDQQVCRQFWHDYGPRLEKLAACRLPDALRRRVGADDVVQSACRTFFRRARAGEFALSDEDGLWRLLCAITLTKVRKQVRFHLRKKRGLDQEGHFESMGGASGEGPWDPAAEDAPPDEAAAFADELEQLMKSLDEEEQQLVWLKLEGRTQQEIAEELGCAERTVRRILNRVRSHLSRLLEQSQ